MKIEVLEALVDYGCKSAIEKGTLVSVHPDFLWALMRVVKAANDFREHNVHLDAAVDHALWEAFEGFKALQRTEL